MSGNSVRCPECDNRIVRERDGQLLVMMDGLVIVKSEGLARGKCKDCHKAISVPVSRLSGLSDAIVVAIGVRE